MLVEVLQRRQNPKDDGKDDLVAHIPPRDEDALEIAPTFHHHEREFSVDEGAHPFQAEDERVAASPQEMGLPKD